MDFGNDCPHIGKLLQFSFLPGKCLLCGLPTHRTMDLCEPCEQSLPWNLNACPGCALPQAAPMTRSATQLCPQCQRHRPAVDGICAPFIYQDDIARLLSRGKFGAGFAGIALVSELCIERLRTLPALPDALIPVPLSWRRTAVRGYNQSALIAHHFGKTLGIRVDLRALARKRHTRPQSELSRSARLKNLAGAFCARKDLSGKSVALIDDVLTTGATALAASKALKKAGAQHVSVWVCARTPSS